MHFQGQTLVSQATHVSSRTLVTVSLAKIFAIWYGINTSDLEVLGLKLGDAFVTIAPWMIGFFALNHMLSWLGDLHAFQAWNSPVQMTEGAGFGHGGKPLRSRVGDALARMKDMDASATSLRNIADEGKAPENEKEVRQSAENLIAQSQKLKESLDTLLRRTDLLTFHAKTYLWGWFLAMPMGLAAYAIWLALNVS